VCPECFQAVPFLDDHEGIRAVLGLHRGRGIGRALARRAVLEAVALDLDKMVVEVVADQAPTIAMFRALGFDQVDLVGFSLGGFITQVIAQQEPQLVRKIVLAGTGPAGGEGIDKVTSVTIRDMIKGALTFKDPKYYLFFTRTANGRLAARQFLKRLKERTDNRDTSISLTAFRRQLKAIHAWGRQEPADLTGIQQPVLVVNGEHDRMVPSSNTVDLARRLPHAELRPLYRDAGHGGIFQYHEEFVARVLEFLER
jgi:pimeloyl-ACP methyl ester carboxylesterase